MHAANNGDALQGYHLAPSILSANFSRLGQDIETVLHAGATVVHVDVMDGHFVPNITIGPLVVKAIESLSHANGATIDVHLMISEPERYWEEFADAGADWITVHAEASYHLHRLLSAIKGAGKKAGVSLNPATPIESILTVTDEIDFVLVMTVNPGFGGQKFIPQVLDKIRRLRAELPERIAIEVDGGIGKDNIGTLKEAGANIFVAGSSIFGAPDPRVAVKDLLAPLQN